MSTQEILERMRELTDPKLALEQKQRMDETVKYAMEHQEKWRKVHPNCWIAVSGKKLVAAEPTSDRLVASVKKSGVPLADTYVNFLTEEKPIFVL
jgi:hypothetical protein